MNKLIPITRKILQIAHFQSPAECLPFLSVSPLSPISIGRANDLLSDVFTYQGMGLSILGIQEFDAQVYLWFWRKDFRLDKAIKFYIENSIKLWTLLCIHVCVFCPSVLLQQWFNETRVWGKIYNYRFFPSHCHAPRGWTNESHWAVQWTESQFSSSH